MAARNSGGLVIVQVERIAERGTLNPRQVKIPGILVDCVVVAEGPSTTWQTFASPVQRRLRRRDPRAARHRSRRWRLNERKIIARRAALELKANSVVNLGIGMPEGVADVAAEESITDLMTLTAEPGVIGGVPAGGLNFGAAINAAGDHRPALPVRLLRRRRARRGVPRPGPGRPARQSQRQQVRPAARRRRRLHQHQPERQEGGVRRHVHGRRARGRGRGRPARDRQRGQRAASSSPRSSTGPSPAAMP